MTPPVGAAPFRIPGPLWAHTGDKGWTCIQWAPAQQGDDLVLAWPGHATPHRMLDIQQDSRALGSHLIPCSLQSLPWGSGRRYYLIYDYGDRKSLLGTYHIEACFSLTIPFNPKDPALNSFCEYFKYNRDIKKLKNSYQWKQLKHTKRDILDTLCVLPKTRHDLSSFVVDMWFQTETMLCFSVNGLFKEVEGKSPGSVRAFIRTFIAIPGSNSSLCIINDKLFVRDTSPQGNQSPFCIPMATCSSTPVPALSQEQQEMVQAFSVRSGMNLKWSQK
ncbi:Hypothetical predicted protein [Marmota monax]|uniref:NTF2 domain-containing protein n=1 Tax=Marmota monax TaxID=9995 RepID=A0A5E4CYB9_MARMO|nr:hypothetical protein GHT09_015412 [Marmota monax]VTJ86260.1 Hypothetical predicted protein [Marmota monax]